MDFPVADPIQEAIASVVSRRSYGYPWPREDGRSVATAFADRMGRKFGWEIDAQRVRVLTDVVQAVATCVHAFSDPRDGIVVQTPSYPPLLRVVDLLGRRLVANPLRDTGTRFELDIDGLRQAVSGTRMVLFCHPHNPTGRVFEAHELEALRDIVVEHDLIVVSDEIHADLVYPPRRHLPLALVDPELGARTVTLNSASKSFNLAGLRCGVAHFGSDALAERFDSCFPPELLGHVSNVSLEATIAAWDSSEKWLADALGVLGRNREMLVERIRRDLPGAVCHEPDATYLAWIDCRALELGAEPPAFFLDRARVALKGGTDFGDEARGFVRVNFANEPEVLDAILDRMAAAAGGDT
jgi:cystathionine beta-lyase